MKARKKIQKTKPLKEIINWQSIIIFLIGCLITHIYYRHHARQYLEQQVPEIDCYYKYLAIDDKCEFNIKNVGLVDCKNVWVEEKIYVIVDSDVYEGEDVPRFVYLMFKDSRTKMWDLPKKDPEKPIKLRKLQRTAFRRLVEKYEPKIISRWIISFSSETSSKRYSSEEYFIHNLEDRIPQNLHSCVGGESILNKIKDYLALGPPQAIRIFDLTEDFELNTPVHYWINKDYSIIPLYSTTKLSIEEINNSVYFCQSSGPQVSDDMRGTITFIWKYKDGKWSKWISIGPQSQVVTTVMRTWFSYLIKDDAERVRKNPELIKFLDPNRPPRSKERQKEIEKEIREKARKNILVNSKNSSKVQ